MVYLAIVGAVTAIGIVCLIIWFSPPNEVIGSVLTGFETEERQRLLIKEKDEQDRRQFGD